MRNRPNQVCRNYSLRHSLVVKQEKVRTSITVVRYMCASWCHCSPGRRATHALLLELASPWALVASISVMISNGACNLAPACPWYIPQVPVSPAQRGWRFVGTRGTTSGAPFHQGHRARRTGRKLVSVISSLCLQSVRADIPLAPARSIEMAVFRTCADCRGTYCSFFLERYRRSL